jgi:hypothetical protein
MVPGVSNGPNLVVGAPIAQRSAQQRLRKLRPAGMQGLPSRAKGSAGRG